MSEIKSKILMGDCLEVLATYPDSFFDLIITSPPPTPTVVQILMLGLSPMTT